jgi:hypothetical protein
LLQFQSKIVDIEWRRFEMASPGTLKARALAQMTSAIRNVLNPADEHLAQFLNKEKIPEQGKYPQVDFQRQHAIEYLWNARQGMDAINIPLAKEKGYKSDKYLGALKDIKAQLSGSAVTSAKKALDETDDAEIAARLRAAQLNITHVQYDVRLMESRFWRTVASGWFVFTTIILAIAAGLLYYVLYGATSLGLEAAQKPGLATLPANTASNVEYLKNLLETSTEVTDTVTKLVKALNNLFSAIPLAIAGGFVTLKGLAADG